MVDLMVGWVKLFGRIVFTILCGFHSLFRSINHCLSFIHSLLFPRADSLPDPRLPGPHFDSSGRHHVDGGHASAGHQHAVFGQARPTPRQDPATRLLPHHRPLRDPRQIHQTRLPELSAGEGGRG